MKVVFISKIKGTVYFLKDCFLYKNWNLSFELEILVLNVLWLYLIWFYILNNTTDE